MSLKWKLKLRPTLALRLTVWYTLLFSVSSFVTIVVFYILITSITHKSQNQDLLAELAEFSALLVEKGMDELKSAIIQETRTEGVDKVFIRVLSLKGNPLVSSDVSSWKSIDVSKTALNRINSDSNHVFETLPMPGSRTKARILYGMLGHDNILQIGKRLEDEERFAKTFWRVCGPMMAGLMTFAALIGWFMAKRALMGVEEVTRTALQISGGAFNQRVKVRAKDEEIKTLAAAFNGMLDRTEAAMTEIKEISDNIAHDLRSPIARIRGIAEMTLATGKSIEEYEDMAANTIEQCDQLLAMINTMLEICETEAGAVRLTQEEVDISMIVMDACDLFLPAAEGKGLTIVCDVPDNVIVCGEIQKLQRLVVNLLDNAVKYTSSGGIITVSIDQSEEQVFISFHDTGIGISSKELSLIFARFYRCDESRSQPGVGLGLSLAMAIARSHGGNIRVNSHPGAGSTFSVNLPRRPVCH